MFMLQCGSPEKQTHVVLAETAAHFKLLENKKEKKNTLCWFSSSLPGMLPLGGKRVEETSTHSSFGGVFWALRSVICTYFGGHGFNIR